MSSTIRILLGLAAGLGLGALLAALAPPWRLELIAVTGALGDVWLDGLRMTIVPLVFALLVTGVAQAAGTMRAGGIAGWTLVVFAVLLLASAILAAVLAPLILDAWPAPGSAAAALRTAARGGAAVPPPPPFATWLEGFVPANPIRAAADGAMAPLVFFALVFGLAATRIEEAAREALFRLFDAIRAAMMVIVAWVLWAAPAGVFALALVFGARVGVAGLGVLAHYVVVVSSLCLAAGFMGLLVALIGGRLAPGRFLSAMAPVGAVAISTQSSLAALPTMLRAASTLGVGPAVRDLVLPMGVALFRITSPAANMTVVIYVAHLYGLPLDAGRMIAGVIVAALTSLAAVGIASSVTFFTTLAPISMAMGMPMDLLPLFLAVETLPDLSRTIGNVTGHVGVAALMQRWRGTSSGEETWREPNSG